MSLNQIPSSQRAIQEGEDGHLHLVNEAAIPTLPPGYVLVKTFAVALNPSDHKIHKNFPIPGSYLGADFSGTVVQIAENFDSDISLPVGTMVCSTTNSFTPLQRRNNGAFAEYLRVQAHLVMRVPSPAAFPGKETISSLQGATLGTAVATCLLALWSPEALDLSGTPDFPNMPDISVPVLVYGGSTATGTIAVQLLKLSGYSPIATCSPRNFDLVRGRGATAVFDYADVDVASKIKLHTGGKLKYVLDCISNVDSVTICYDAIQRPGGRYASLEPIPEKLLAKRRAVRYAFVMAGEVFGEGIELGADVYDRPPSQEKHELAVRYMKMIQRLLDEGKLKAHPTELLQGGLQGVMSGLERLEKEGVSGKKLVAYINAES